MYKIDNIDLEIVSLLMDNGRIHAAEIAPRARLGARDLRGMITLGVEPGRQRDLVDIQYQPDQEAIAGEATRRANATLESMPNKQRTAFLLRNQEGLPIADIAKVLAER